ncbi:Heme exporter protein B [Saliniradius amylolyticus]|uniref:Heme exporter protein B n=1 Tax=Saliniradius amylolyticus TaxID=2183582 RepID=A0A2S2E119_9ALTE|nr:heme exporter protein CcmB [Saliniradius amylolyticus]AWL11306.1 Heme exporter protein B [Saliniradius amylolyticus]
MSRGLNAVFARELSLAYQQRSELAQPLVFFILVITLFPLAVGPGPQTLQKLAPGIVWIAALLSSLLGLERLFRDDFEDGWLEQQMLSPIPLSVLVIVKVSTHWLLTIMPLLLISPLLALLLNLSSHMYWALLLTLLIGTPLLSLVGAGGVALTLGLKRGGVLLSLLLLPLFVPLLIFATSAVDAASMQLDYTGQLAIMGALLLLALALMPFATAYGLRVSQN